MFERYVVLKNTGSDTCFAYHCLCNVVGYCFLLFNSCPVDSLANAKDVVIDLECLCILELYVYTVDFTVNAACVQLLLIFAYFYIYVQFCI